ncbi:MAG: molybdopterin-binding protein [Campylobacterota bacterium]|nr:molybdopterin-binding protein [Campylobacterota bacterium]
MNTPHFYALIIGSEILNGRREDKHFSFIKDELEKRGHSLYASFIVKDCPTLLKNIFTLIKNDSKSVMFSFGGIGSTPDDLTRAIAAEIFTCKPLIRHKKFEADIIERFGDEAFPHRIFMSDLPENSQLLQNPINNMSGFYLDKRYFFVPGFPSMAHPMIEEALERYYDEVLVKNQRLSLLADTSENTLISIMNLVHSDIELSSLPMFKEGNAKVEISLASKDPVVLKKSFDLFILELERLSINYKIL